MYIITLFFVGTEQASNVSCHFQRQFGFFVKSNQTSDSLHRNSKSTKLLPIYIENQVICPKNLIVICNQQQKKFWIKEYICKVTFQEINHVISRIIVLFGCKWEFVFFHTVGYITTINSSKWLQEKRGANKYLYSIT